MDLTFDFRVDIKRVSNVEFIPRGSLEVTGAMTKSPFNPAVEALSPPPIPAVQRWAESYGGNRGPLIDLSQAVPGYPPHPDLLRWLAEAAGSSASAGYGPIEGDDALREAYAGHVSALYGAPLGASNIHVTAGCNQAFVAACLAVAGAGDKVLLTNPFYFNHETSLAMLGIGVETVSCGAEDGFVPAVAAVEAAIVPGVRALALVSPNNPTGAVYPPDRIAALFDLCRRRGIWLILDETYRDFLPPDQRPAHRLFSVPRWEEGLIQLYSFSKSFCIPGHRLGVITAGKEAIAAIARIMDNLQICAPRPPQSAVARALPALRDWRAANALEISRRAEALKEAMKGVEGWEIGAVGAYFAYLRHPFRDASSVEAARKLAGEAGVLAIPGEYFGPGQQDYLRFAFANADVETIRLLRPRLGAF
jgi:aspartate/methionine/tyrosine aminotransferase